MSMRVRQIELDGTVCLRPAASDLGLGKFKAIRHVEPRAVLLLCLGVDIAKNVFQLHGVNWNGHVVLKQRPCFEPTSRASVSSW